MELILIYGVTLISISFLAFIIAIALSFVPVYVSPVGSVRTDGNYDEHDKWLYRSSVAGIFIILLLPLLLTSPIWHPVLNYLWVNHLISFLSVSFFFVVFILPIILIILFSCIHNWMTQMLRGFMGYKHSIRPLGCMRCKASLKKIDTLSILEYLSPQEQVAAKIGSIVFEAWYCHKCYVQPRRHSVHLRAYILAPYAYRSQTGFFKFCPICKEITMTKTTTRVIEEVTYDGGELLNIYTCQYCSRTEAHSEIIPARDID